jgi:hypothetical protein
LFLVEVVTVKAWHSRANPVNGCFLATMMLRGVLGMNVLVGSTSPLVGLADCASSRVAFAGRNPRHEPIGSPGRGWMPGDL